MAKTNPSDKYYLYFLECCNGSIYTGSSGDVNVRFEKHQSGHGSTWTKNNEPVRILAVKPYPNRTAAYSQERKLKKYSKDKKIRWIMANCHFDAESITFQQGQGEM